MKLSRIALVAVVTGLSLAGVGVAAATPAAPACNANYEPCVPVSSDVDCAGGTGNGPTYVEGPVRVVGVDEYGLDADKDGTGCDNGEAQVPNPPVGGAATGDGSTA